MTIPRDRLIGARVEVTWVDSSGVSGWLLEGDLRHYRIQSCRTCGYLVARDARQVQVCLNSSAASRSRPYGDLMSIPMAAVQSIHKVTRTRRVRKLH